MLSQRLLIVNWTQPVPLSILAHSPLDIFPESKRVQRHIRALANLEGRLLLDTHTLHDPRPLSQVRVSFLQKSTFLPEYSYLKRHITVLLYRVGRHVLHMHRLHDLRKWYRMFMRMCAYVRMRTCVRTHVHVRSFSVQTIIDTSQKTLLCVPSICHLLLSLEASHTNLVPA